MKNIGIGMSYGKIILMGEHAVVYHKPAIALPFKGAQATASFQLSTEAQTLMTPFYSGDLNHAVIELEGIIKMTQALMDAHFDTHQNFILKIDSTIPIQRGLGSSAAVSTAVVKAFYDWIEKPLEFQDMMHYVGIAEAFHHGKASGIDSWVIGTNQPTLFRRDMLPEFISLPKGVLVVVDTEVLGLTKEAVAKVRRYHEDKPEHVNQMLDEIERLTLETQSALAQEMLHVVGANMTQVHRILQRLGVSTGQLDHLVTQALSDGALGAKLTGAGLGGCMVALFETDSQAHKFVDTLDYPYWVFEIGSDHIG